MAATKITDLSATTTLGANDLFVVVTNPSNAPATKKVKAGDVLSSLANIVVTPATTNTYGTVKIGDNLYLNGNGALSANAGGGIADTGDITFTNNVISVNGDNDLIIASSNNNAISIESNNYVQLAYSQSGDYYGGGNNTSYVYVENGGVYNNSNRYDGTNYYWSESKLDPYGSLSVYGYNGTYSYNFVFETTNASTLAIKPSPYFNNRLGIEPTMDYDIHIYEVNTRAGILVGKPNESFIAVYGPGGNNGGEGLGGNNVLIRAVGDSPVSIGTAGNNYIWNFTSEGNFITPGNAISIGMGMGPTIYSNSTLFHISDYTDTETNDYFNHGSVAYPTTYQLFTYSSIANGNETSVTLTLDSNSNTIYFSSDLLLSANARIRQIDDFTIGIKPSRYYNNELAIVPTGDYDIHLYEANTGGAVTLGNYGATNFRVYGPGGANGGGGQYGNDIRAELYGNSSFTITSNNGNFAWKFDEAGSLTSPFQLSNARTGTGHTLKLGDNSQQIIITGAQTSNDSPTAQRLVIAGADGSNTGEGGDIYLWAGRSGFNGGSGGDIKVDAGNGYANSDGGSVKIRAGNSDTGTGGFVEIWSGSGGNGAPITLHTHSGSYWNQWSFDTAGRLVLPSNGDIVKDGQSVLSKLIKGNNQVILDQQNSLYSPNTSVNISYTGTAANNDQWVSVLNAGTSNTQLLDQPVNTVAFDNDGNLITGTTTSFGYTTYPIIIKQDPLGNILWQYAWIDSEVSLESLKIDSNNNIIAACNDYTNNSASVIKFDSNGNVLWTKNLPNSYRDVYDVCLNSNGQIFVVLSRYNSTTSIISLDSSGNLLWAKLDTDDRDMYSCVATDTYVLVGQNNGNVSAYDFNGNYQWTINAIPSNQEVWGLAWDGTDWYAADFTNNLVKVSGADNTTILWNKTINISSQNYSVYIAYSNNNLYVVCNEPNENNDYGLIAVKLNAQNGNLVWSRILYNPAYDFNIWYWYGHSNIAVHGNYYAISGYLESAGYLSKGVVAHFNINDNPVNSTAGPFNYANMNNASVIDNTNTPNGILTPHTINDITLDQTIVSLTPNIIDPTANTQYEQHFLLSDRWSFTPGVGLVFPDGSIQTTAGRIDIPQNLYTQLNNYTLKLSDRGKHVLVSQNYAVEIPDNATTSFPIGSTIVIVSSGNPVGILPAAGSNTVIYNNGTGVNSTSSADLGFYINSYTMATLLKVGADTWILSAPNLQIGW